MLLVAEIGSCWHPEDPGTIVEAAKAALKCGASMVKLQVYGARELAARRGGAGLVERLAPWALPVDRFRPLARLLEQEGVPFGVSVFGPVALGAVESEARRLQFIKTATSEYGWAKLAELVSAAAYGQTQVWVSMPEDGCCTVGNYHSGFPISWLYCVPHYPAKLRDYREEKFCRMLDVLPGRCGVSDHTPDEHLFGAWAPKFLPRLGVWEKHFCYDEALRSSVPDGGPWSLGVEAFGRFVESVWKATG